MISQIIGTKDISKIGDGTITGALNALLKKSAVINTNTVTEAGFALDARQANPNIPESLGAQINMLNTNLENKYHIKLVKNDWSEFLGAMLPVYYPDRNTVEIISDSGGGNYPAVTVARAYHDENGNRIPNTYLTKTDANNDFLKYREHTTNANWALASGIYNTSTDTVDAADYGALLVINSYNIGFNGRNWIFQVWFRTNGTIQTRRSINATDGSGWTAWETISKS